MHVITCSILRPVQSSNDESAGNCSEAKSTALAVSVSTVVSAIIHLPVVPEWVVRLGDR